MIGGTSGKAKWRPPNLFHNSNKNVVKTNFLRIPKISQSLKDTMTNVYSRTCLNSGNGLCGALLSPNPVKSP